MGCGSSQQVQDPQGQPHNVPNGNVKRESSPPIQPVQPVRRQTPEQKSRESSAHSKKSQRSRKSSSSSSSSSNSSKASVKEKEKAVEPVVQAAPVIVNEQPTHPEITEEKPAEETPKPVVAEEAEEKPAASAPTDEAATTSVPTEETTTASNQDEQPEDTERTNFSEDSLKRFAELENEIKEMEAKDHGGAHMAKYQELVELHKTLTAKAAQLEELKKQTAKEYQDIVSMNHPSVRAMFANKDQHDNQLSKEYQEYLDALNKQEVCEQELTSKKEQYKNLYNVYNSETESVKKDAEVLNEKKLAQEALLGKIFNDTYASEKEWKLEMDLDLLADKKERIGGAHHKWTNAKKFHHTAVSQILWAVQRWYQIGQHNIQAPMVKYQMSAETRNHLVAAAQNIQTCYRFLTPIKLPYYTEDDITQLNNAINTIFHDVQTTSHYQAAYAIYLAHYNKALNLLKWIDNVLENTIKKDFTEVKKAFHGKYYELKEERITLIQAKIKVTLGIEMDLEVKKDEFKDDTEDAADNIAVAAPGDVAKEEGDESAPALETMNGPPPESPVGTEGEGAEAEAGEGSPETGSEPAVKAVPLNELAPAPTTEDLFGNIEDLKKKHEEEMLEFEKAQELNKTRVEQGLQEKLRARRSRRRKIESQKAEEAELKPPEE